MEFVAIKYTSDMNAITSRTIGRYSSYDNAKKDIEKTRFRSSEVTEVPVNSYAMSEFFWAKNIQPYCVRAVMFNRDCEIWAYTIEEIESFYNADTECESCKL